MTLHTGDRIRQFEVISPLGAGGMGEVYRARDLNLGRDVAIKVLPETFVADAERVARFQREAQILAALHHPNIATIFGLEDNGPSKILVMELVDGETLAARLARGPLPVDEAVALARQIAEALSAAHDKGIVHRDMKPGNVMLRHDGGVKVLDFGLAKRIDLEPAVSGLSMSPTLSIQATVAGTLLGTTAYMSPEQARGRAVDKRTDVWAFGCVLFEMLTGTRAFGGDDLTETIATIVKGDPDWTALDAVAPPHLSAVVRGCLAKDPKQRFSDIAVPLHLLANARPAESAPAIAPQLQSASKLPWAFAALATLALLATLGWIYATRSGSPQPGLAARFTITPGKGTVLTPTTAGGTQQAVSPDGRYITYVADDTQEGRARLVLWIRAIDSLGAQRLDSTTGATEPFWSPDSRQIAYFADGKIKRIPVTGGSPVNVADYKSLGPGQTGRESTARSTPRGGFWFRDRGGNDDGVIVWADDAGPIQRVSAAGGVVTAITTLGAGETAHAYPQMLPDGSTLLFYARGEKQEGIWAQDLKSGTRTFLFPTTKRVVVAGADLLLFTRDTTLFGQRWNFSTLKPAGEPVAIADNVRIGNNSPRSTISSSLTGTLVFRIGGSTGAIGHRWYSIDGKVGEMIDRAGVGGPVEISPDGRWAIAFTDNDLELLDITTGNVSVIATGLVNYSHSYWSPDSRRVLFTTGEGTYQAFIGTGKTTLLYPGGGARRIDGYITGIEHITDWTKDGLVVGGAGKVGLVQAPEETASGPLPFAPKVLGDIQGDQFRVSPNGKWVTYSAPSQTKAAVFYRDVWIAAFPSLTNRRLVAPGTEPRWGADGRLLFGRDSVLYAVELKPGPLPDFSAPRLLLRAEGMSMGGAANVWGWAITPDGTRVLARSRGSAATEASEDIHVVLNWPALIK